jgi:hypothetical protein
MCESGSKENSPGEHHIEEPHKKTRDRPNNGNSHEPAIAPKQTNRQEQVAYIAHPKHVTKLANSPIVNGLSQKEHERKDSNHAKSDL